MKLTNKLGLHKVFKKAIEMTALDYVPVERDFGVTELLQPARVAVLTKTFDSSLEEDAHDKRNALYGSAFHNLMQRAALVTCGSTSQVEKSLSAKVEVDGTEYTIAGTPDLIENGVITDWKTCKVWKIVNQDFLEWEQQLNMYAWLAGKNSCKINDLQVVSFILDWSAAAARRNKDFPPTGVVTIPFNKWDLHLTESFIKRRVREHVKAREVLPLCTDEEIKRKPTVYAVTKVGASRATKLCSSMEEAQDFIERTANQTQMEIQVRPGELIRCDSFPCPARTVCEQYASYKRTEK